MQPDLTQRGISMSIESMLAQVPLFSHLPDEMFDELASMGKESEMESGQIICRQDDISNAIHVLLIGEARVYKLDNQGNEIQLAIVGANNFFGEMSILDNKPH